MFESSFVVFAVGQALTLAACRLAPDPSAVPNADRIVADHTVVDKYDTIPQKWIDQVKTMWLNVPGESHSYGYRQGLVLLASLNSTFAASAVDSGNPEGYTDQHLRVSRATWTQYSSWSYSYGEQDWYTNSSAITNTKNHLNHCNSNDLTIAAFGFGWCWDMMWTNVPGGGLDPVYQVHWAGSSEGGPEGNLRWGLDPGDSSLTGNSICMDTYLNATQQYIDYCESIGSHTKVFFTTGPVDSYTGETAYQRQLKHEYIRNYVAADKRRILFDYADILAWDDEGEQNLDSWVDYLGNVHMYQMIHADNLLNLAGTGTDPDCGHIGERGALRLGKALWWMLARVAGWNGKP